MSTTWSKVRLGEVLTPVSRGQAVDPTREYRLLGIRLDGQGPFLRETVLGSQSAATKLHLVAKGDFVYSRLFACRGAFGVISKELDGCYVSGEFPTFLPIPDKVDVEFLRLWFRLPSVIARVNEDCTGSTPLTRNRFKERFFLTLEILLPSLVEQRRIVARIEALAAQITEARSLRLQAAEEIEVLGQSIAATALRCEGDTTVGDFVKIQSGYAFKSNWFTEDGIRLVRNVNIGHGNVVWDQIARIPESRRAEFKAFDLAEGEILVSLDRPIISTGVKVARVSKHDLPSLLLQRVGRVRFTSDGVLPNFFFAWLRSPHFINAIDPGRSNGVPHISPKDIERIPFALPLLAEQRRVLGYLDSLMDQVDTLARLQAETTAELDALLPSVLAKAFRGELTFAGS